jgi:hypothetical protein
VDPVFDEKVVSDRNLLTQAVMNEWIPLTGGTGSLRVRVSYRPNQV